MDKTRLSFKRFRIFLAVGFIIFPILATLTLTYQNSIFDLVEGFSKINVLAGRAQNAPTNVFKEGAQNVTVQARGEKYQNITWSVVGKAICLQPISLLHY